jgi:hypothetical protein
MRTLLTAGTAGLLLTIGPASAEWRTTPFRPAIDDIGNAEPPALEGVAGVPNDVGFGPDNGPPAPRGRVTIDSGTATPASVHFGRRKIWTIPVR